MIEFREVRIAFNGRPVLDGTSFAVRFSEKAAILGGSGEGKTTILKLILGLLRPDDGAIYVNGRDITQLSESALGEVRTLFSILFQEGALFDSLSVGENVAFSLCDVGGLAPEEAETVVRSLLRQVGIEDAIDLMPEELSGGMQRRAAIARSLAVCQPRMILYDEPTTGLDPITADTICDLINDLSVGTPEERTGLIIVTHDVPHAARVAERFLYLRGGRIAFDGDLKALKSAKDPEVRKFIREIL